MAQPQGRPILGARSPDSMPLPEPSDSFNMMSMQNVLPPEGPVRSKRPPVSEVMGASNYSSNLVPGIDTSRPPPLLYMGASDVQPPPVTSGLSVNARSFEPPPMPLSKNSASNLSASAKSFEPQPSVGLSANARVFEPQQSYNIIQQQQFYQSNMGGYLNANASEFVPQNYGSAGPNENLYYSEAGYGEEWTEDVIPDSVTCVRYAMDVLYMQPGDFDSVMPELTASLEQCIYDEQSLVAVITELAEQAIVEPNFRYTASRMCHYVCENLETKLASGTFRQYLMKWIRVEFERRDEMKADPQLRERLCGFTVFLAELFVNMTLPGGARITKLAEAVKQLVVTLLTMGDEGSLKCAGQVLKLTGYALVDHEANSAEPSLKSIIQTLKLIILDTKCHQSVKAMLVSIVELSANNWGREPEAEVTGAAALPELMGTTYYDQGHPVVKQDDDGGEEQDLEEDFLLHEQYLNDLVGDGDHSTYEDNEYSDEIALAYEQFLKDNEQRGQQKR